MEGCLLQMYNLNMFCSCVSRDIFGIKHEDFGWEINKSDKYNVQQYANWVSPIFSSYPGHKINEDAFIKAREKYKNQNPDNFSNFAWRCKYIDITHSCLDFLKKGTPDYLIIDNWAAFYDYYMLDDGTIVTDKSGDILDYLIAEKVVPPIKGKFDFSDIPLDKLEVLVRTFAENIKTIFKPEQIILIKLKAADYYIDGDGKVNSFGSLSISQKIRAKLDVYFSVLSKYFSGCRIIRTDTLLFGSSEHKWGMYPFHYVDEVYFNYYRKKIDMIVDGTENIDTKMVALDENFAHHIGNKYLGDSYHALLKRDPSNVKISQKEMQMIHISYAIYDKTGSYSSLLGTSICSVLENTKEKITIHLLHDESLTEENKEKLKVLCDRYNASVVFYNAAVMSGELNEAVRKTGLSFRFSPASFYRLMLMCILPEDIKKIIYLDCDTIVNMDIREIWYEEAGINGIGAIPEMSIYHNNMPPNPFIDAGTVKREHYFNSGVLVIDMDKYREYPNLIVDALELLEAHPEYELPDQDVMNYFFSKEYRALDAHYNIFPHCERLFKNQIVEKGIYHYAMSAVDLFDLHDVYNVLFFDYYVKTPWFDGRKLLDICRKSIEYIYEWGNAFWRSVINRQVIFCADDATLQFLRDKVNIRPDSLFFNIYVGSEKIDLGNAIAYMRNNPAKSPVLFIVSSAYPQIKAVLQKNGLQENRNFVNGASISYAISKRSYPGGRVLFKKCL